MTFGFLSHVDKNLYLFRLPIMVHLVSKGHTVYAITPKGEYSQTFIKHGIMPIHYTINRQSLNPFSELKAIIAIYKVLSPLRLDCLTTFMLKPNIYGALVIACLRFGGQKIELICAVTGLGSFYIEQNYQAKLIKWLSQKLYRLAFLIANKVIFQNNDDRSLFIAKNIVAATKTVLIRSSGVDSDFFSPDRVDRVAIEQLREKMMIKTQDIVILMIARLVIHKGVGEYIHVAIQLKKKFPRSHFLLIGDVDEGSRFAIDKELLQQACDTNSIIWLGEITNRDHIKNYLALSDIFVLPSYREGVPRTLLEAGAMAKPLVTCNSVGCKEVVKEGYNGFLVPVKEVGLLADRITTLINTPPLRKKMADNARVYIHDNFTIQDIVKLYILLYKV